MVHKPVQTSSVKQITGAKSLLSKYIYFAFLHAAALFADSLKIFRGKVVLRQSLNNQERDIQRQTCLELESFQDFNFRLGIQTFR